MFDRIFPAILFVFALLGPASAATFEANAVSQGQLMAINF